MVRLSEVSYPVKSDGSPSLIISGDYMREFGFDVGCRVVIEAAKKCIVIKLVDVDEAESF